MSDARPVTAAALSALRHLPVFLAVARLGSFTRAAADIHVSQASVSLAVRQLEQSLGVQLFRRTTRTVSLTPQGAEFVLVAERLLRDCSFALHHVRTASDERERQLRIAAVHSVATKVLPQAMEGFSHVYPDVQVVLRDGNSAEVLRAVRLNEVDIGFATSYDDPQLTFRPLFRDAIGVLARSGHALFMKQRPLQWRDLERFQFIGFTDDTATRWVLDKAAMLPGNIRAPRLMVSNYVSLWAMLQATNAVTTVPHLSVSPGAGLTFRPLRNPIVTRTVCMVGRAKMPLPFAAARAMDFVCGAVLELGHCASNVEALI